MSVGGRSRIVPRARTAPSPAKRGEGWGGGAETGRWGAEKCPSRPHRLRFARLWAWLEQSPHRSSAMFETIAEVADPAVARVLIAALKAHGFHPLEGGDSGLPVLVPHHPQKSRLFLAITRKEADLVMPPKENDRLSADEMNAMPAEANER